jgi:RNA ligase
MLLNDIIDLGNLEAEIAAGYISRRIHPEFPTLAIIGYSDTCQYDNRWNETTMACRGIIYDTVTLVVLARPFPKFFNHGQGDAVYDLDAPILGAFNKFDGSLGIGYIRPDGIPAIATRGSFVSEQAAHANQHPALEGMVFTSDVTPLFEIVYPENRIVLDYGTADELYPLGHISISTGSYTPAAGLTSEATTLREALETEPRTNAEGFVVWFDDRTAVKIKQADYVELHRIVSSLSAKEIWRQLQAGTFTTFATALPDEFHGWAKTTADTITIAFNAVATAANHTHQTVLAACLDGERKSQALWLKANADPALIGFAFQLLDGKDITASVWRTVEPHGATQTPTPQLTGANV